MSSIQPYYRPQTIQEAAALLSEHGTHARALAGGTSLVFSRVSPEIALIDLADLGLNYLHTDPGGSLKIGAMLSCAQLENEIKLHPATALSDALHQLGTKILRNHIRVGGNSLMIYAWSDLPVVFMSIDARFSLDGNSSGPRTISCPEFFEQHPLKVLNVGELLTEICIPWTHPGVGSSFIKFGQNHGDQAMVSIATALWQKECKIQAARICVGGARARPQLLEDASAMLLEHSGDKVCFEQVAAHAAQEAMVSEDNRISADYRRHLIEVFVSDSLHESFRRAGGNQ